MVENNLERVKRINTKMSDEIGPTFCMAKWHHTTIYLHRGQTHSCYHPRPHDIPLDELEARPSALHNTQQKIRERAEMLMGGKPEGCQYCWNVESLDNADTDTSDQHISDRMTRNSTIYTPERLDDIKDNNVFTHHVNPQYIEVAFSNECNFKCGYCHPMHSSSFFQEVKKHGPVKNVKNHSVDISWFEPLEEETNPYIDAWWKWWPEMSKDLTILRITGGEPLLHKTTWEMFERLEEEPLPNLEINLNSNLGMTSRHVKKLVTAVNSLLSQNKIKAFKLFSSMETWGARAEYLRTGLDVDLWEKNQDIYIRGTKRHISHMSTFNILTVTSYIDFLKKILEWRKLYDDVIPNDLGHHENVRKIRFDSPYLKEPLQYDMHLLPKEEFLPYFDEALQFIKDNLDNDDTTKFDDLEYERFRRVRDYFATSPYDDHRIEEGRKDFYNWFTEYDKRRGTNFHETFPDYVEFFNSCKDLVDADADAEKLVIARSS